MLGVSTDLATAGWAAARGSVSVTVVPQPGVETMSMLAVVLVDERLHHGEAETRPLDCSLGGGGGAVEAIEEARDVLGLDAVPGVLDGDGDRGRGGLRLEPDRAAAGGELDGVGQQVEQDAFEVVRAPEHGGCGRHAAHLEVDPPGLGEGDHRSSYVVDEPVQSDTLRCGGCSVLGVRPGEQEEVLDEQRETICVARHGREHTSLLVGDVSQLTCPQELEVADDAAERGAELVRDVGDQLVLEAVCSLEHEDRLLLLLEGMGLQERGAEIARHSVDDRELSR